VIVILAGLSGLVTALPRSSTGKVQRYVLRQQAPGQQAPGQQAPGQQATGPQATAG
jgi:hypothetical protein